MSANEGAGTGVGSGPGLGGGTSSTSGVAAKITHVKTTGIDSNISGPGSTISISGTSLTAAPGGTIMTTTGGTIKVASGGTTTSTLSGTPITLNSGQSTTAASIRALSTGGQSTQVRVVMPTGIMQQSMIKQLESATGTGRTHITAIPAAPARTGSNASITVTRPVTQATYLPRAGVTASQMTGVGVAATGQRLVTPLRTATTNVTPAATGLTTAGSFVRGTAVSRSTVAQPTTVISSATSTAWMTANSSGQVQLIRTIPHQSRQRIITTQGISTGSANSGSSAGTNTGGLAVTVSGNIMTTTPSGQAQAASSTIQAVNSSTGHGQSQQAYVAVLPPRQHQATLVYQSNVSGVPTSQAISQSPQQFNPTVSTGQRFAVATPLTASVTSSSIGAGTTAATRQIRPIPLGKPFSTTKLNTTSISIRAPSIPQLTSTLSNASGVVSTGQTSITATQTVVATPTRNTPGVGSSAVSATNVLTTTNLPTTRIIQLQQPASGTAQQLIGSAGRLTGNVMLQPIIVNTSSGGKIGIRPPVMNAKVQPSLTITQLGTIGKLPATGSNSTTLTPQNVSAASIHTISGGGSASVSSTVPLSASTSGGPTTVGTAPTQLVNVSQTGQLLSAGAVVTSVAGTAGGATVVPLAITTRGGTGSSILTGTITPIKNANGITVGKMMAQCASDSNSATNSGTSIGTAPTSVFIHQRPSSNSSGALGTSGGVSVSAVPAVASGASVATSSSTSAFLPAGSTIYYESMPASSVQVSTGILSLTTTTASQSTISQAQMISSGGNLAISSLPFATHAGAATTTFTVVPSSAGGRTIGQLQLPISSTGAQLQAVPVRISASQTSVNNGSNAEMGSTAQLVQTAPGQQLIIPAPQTGCTQQLPPQHMVIPLQTSVKVTTTGVGSNATSGGAPMSTVVSSFLRKRDAEGSPIRAAKNLAPTLLSMSSNTVGSGIVGAGGAVILSGVPSPAGSSISSNSYSITSAPIAQISTSSALTVEALATKDRSAAAVSAITTPNARNSRADSPASSDGSTTVSANSSPGVEQQMQDQSMVINRLSDRVVETNNSTHFSPINELYSNHHTSNNSSNSSCTPNSARAATASLEQQQINTNIITINTTQRMNGTASTSFIDNPLRKKARRSTNDSQHSVQSQVSLSLPPPIGNTMGNSTSNATGVVTPDNFSQNNGLLLATTPQSISGQQQEQGNNSHRVNNVTPVVGNKENAKPVEFVLKRPRNCALLSNNTHKQTNRMANNHFQRYSDVKPREERRPTVMEMANQANVMSKVNGWKVYHLRSQMEDMVENESFFYEKMEVMLKELEKDKAQNPELDRVNELIKGNMQRSKIVVDGINEAQNQIMKIFEHKAHVSDILNRCASKRNFKKRDKI